MKWMHIIFLLIVLVSFAAEAVYAIYYFRKKSGIDANAFGRTHNSIQRYSAMVFLFMYSGYLVLAVLTIIWPELPKQHACFPILDDHSFWVFPGFCTSIVGVALMHITHVHMGTSWRIGVDESERTELLTDGPFAMCRNPFFLGVSVAQLGVVMINPHWLSFMLFVIGLVNMGLQARLEEVYLIRMHDRAYGLYCSKTGRFFPGLGKIDWDQIERIKSYRELDSILTDVEHEEDLVENEFSARKENSSSNQSAVLSAVKPNQRPVEIAKSKYVKAEPKRKVPRTRRAQKDRLPSAVPEARLDDTLNDQSIELKLDVGGENMTDLQRESVRLHNSREKEASGQEAIELAEAPAPDMDKIIEKTAAQPKTPPGKKGNSLFVELTETDRNDDNPFAALDDESFEDPFKS